MLDPRFLIAHGLTISGASLLVAAVSYGRWAVAASRTRVRDAIAGDSALRAAVIASVMLIALGRTATDTARAWEPPFWLALVTFTVWRVRHAAVR